MRTRVEPIRLERDANGTPFSPRYGDVYHSRDGAFAQARHVFLGGNGLPDRWAGRAAFTVLETGFGLGTNFLATWRAWRDDPARPARLHFVSIEKHPVDAADLRAVHAGEATAGVLADALAAQWPLPLPGLHRLVFEGGAVTLTLALGDVADVLPNLRIGVDAFYLDGFAPARNPDMWAPVALRALTRLARAEATLATYTVARPVVDALAAGGFLLEKCAGFGTKRDMLTGRFAPTYRVRRHEPPAVPAWAARDAIVLGAGLAGCHVADALARRGWGVTLVDRHAEPAQATSGNFAGALHPVVTRDDNALARLTRTGMALARRSLDALATPHLAARCGFLECAESDDALAGVHAAVDALGFPSTFVRVVDRGAASVIAGRPVTRGGLWFAEGGWARPAAWCRALLAAHGDRIRPRFSTTAGAVDRVDEGWRVCDAAGRTIATAPLVVLAGGADLGAFAAQASLALTPLRGQLTDLRAADCRPPATIVGGDGYCLPVIAGRVVLGASYDEDDDPSPADALHRENVARVERLLPGFADASVFDDVAGRVGFRSVAPDRLPVVGAAIDEPRALADARALQSAHCIDVPRRSGLYLAGALGSRGLTGAPLAGEVIASLVDGEPPPVEADLLDAIDPARLLLRTRRAKR